VEFAVVIAAAVRTGAKPGSLSTVRSIRPDSMAAVVYSSEAG
jgi:hypothetical protein